MIYYETERLVLRNFQNKDLNDLYEYMSTEYATKYNNFGPLSRDKCIQWISKFLDNDSVWAVVSKEHCKVIGHVEFSEGEYGSYDIGFNFNEMYGKRGYATEACKILVKHLFAVVNARRICADMSEKNVSSWKLAERLGFRREGHFIEDDVLFQENTNGEYVYLNSYYYALLKREWETE